MILLTWDTIPSNLLARASASANPSAPTSKSKPYMNNVRFFCFLRPQFARNFADVSKTYSLLQVSPEYHYQGVYNTDYETINKKNTD
jgi:hypothetical protein